ncbi:hypothetical protein Y017_12150 [Alcanivorax sp. 97CO-5]|nr:hypothetical protein Y017_12150 [Alcanivorax sp. 97CO-5]BAP13498.1 hypothetical protein AS19_06470 [Alcanivorax sp. NBRC 101098]
MSSKRVAPYCKGKPLMVSNAKQAVSYLRWPRYAFPPAPLQFQAGLVEHYLRVFDAC